MPNRGKATPGGDSHNRKRGRKPPPAAAAGAEGCPFDYATAGNKPSFALKKDLLPDKAAQGEALTTPPTPYYNPGFIFKFPGQPKIILREVMPAPSREPSPAWDDETQEFAARLKSRKLTEDAVMVAAEVFQDMRRAATARGVLPPLPTTWEEAKAQQPGLMKWDEAKARAKAEGRKLKLIDHLRDTENGYGLWVLRDPGLPRYILLHIGDNSAYSALAQWLGKNKLPSDMHLPTQYEYTDKLIELGLIPKDQLARVGQALERRHQRLQKPTAPAP